MQDVKDDVWEVCLDEVIVSKVATAGHLNQLRKFLIESNTHHDEAIVT